ncbi:uncharacterized protein N7459_006750 [Penicillium hispanicum]|uniref:uncharacterized protein n=1 Tax=Penicillium hispanicum TaxID=1080232 RepID=UPI00254151C3|nr:uncharacterized protein N7459_006750 [Penicillium hispanicum]KAJ5577786.1 hypothetical protein N7459_006750 [Penicillium hispanicum]
MSTKRRGVAASPEVKFHSQKRRKVSDDDLVESENPQRASSEPEADADGSSMSQEDEEEPEADFEGDSLQTAQDKIMSELTRLKDSDGQEVAYPFIGKPDRNLYRDYYEIIQHPVSLRSIQQKVRGTDSRKKPSKTTAFLTWESFEEEVSYLWRNAREYNEDGSEIFILAGGYFKRRVAEAKKLVPNPIQVDGHPEMPRIKLKMSTRTPEPGAQRLTLKLTGQTSETPQGDRTPSGVAVDNESLKRQQELVRTASVNQDVDTHHMSPRMRPLRRQVGSPKSSGAITPSVSEQSHGVAAGEQDTTGMVKDENFMLPSQSTEMRSSHSIRGGPLDSTGSFSYDDISSALICNVQISTHPSLSLPHSFCLDIPPSSTVSQQTVTINLPPSHHLLTVRPTLAVGTTQRQVKVVAMISMQRLHPVGDLSTLAYDIQLHPGTTKVDFEAIAGPAKGVPKSGPPGSEIDYERLTVFFNLLP